MDDNFEQEKKKLLKDLVSAKKYKNIWSDSRNSTVLQNYSYNIRSNKEIVLMTISFNFNELAYASIDLKKDIDVVKSAVNICPYALIYADSELKKDKEFIFDILQNDHNVIKYIDEELLKDKEFALELFTKNKYILQFISDELIDNEEFLYNINEIEKIDENFDCFYCISLRIQKEIEKNPDYLLKFAPPVNYKPAK